MTFQVNRKALENHGHATGGKLSVECQAWCRMIQRCCNPNNAAYKDYGGRGLK